MTLTIPTRELVGALADVIPFASTHPDDTLRGRVALNWDGEVLHTFAIDGVTAGWSRWRPDDPPASDDEPAEDDLFTDWGAAADSLTWTKHVSLADAKEIVKVFKLPPKAGRTPVLVTAAFKTLTLDRKQNGGHTAITMEFATEIAEDFPDVRALIDTAEASRLPISQIAYNPKRLAAFEKVRPHGQFRMQFGGERKATWVQIGTRFVGAVMPMRPDDAEPYTGGAPDA